MKEFLGDTFLLQNETAVRLYDQVKDLPIFDFHNHLSAKEIYEDIRYSNLTELWLAGDHYKWRAMRAMGIPEEKITGSASERDKFDAWAKTMPGLIGNPLFHWTHLELQRYFGIKEVLSPKTADAIWEKTKEQLAGDGFSVRRLLEMQNVKMLGTTDDPADDLMWHKKLKEENLSFSVCPTFRPDQALAIEKDGFPAYLRRLSEASGKDILSLNQLLAVLEERLLYFKEVGCMASDHSLEAWIYQPDGADAEEVFAKRLAGEKLTESEIGAYRSAVLVRLGKLYAKHRIVMQLHIGAVRNQSARLFAKIGADVGCDGMDDRRCIRELTALLSALDETDELPRTILYGLNPSMNEPLTVLAGSFGGEGIRCKVQYGPAWWFCDHKHGMEEQMVAFAQGSLFSGFVGMTTDSRSFLSFPRHEYFRRILCNLVGTWVENGEYPDDPDAWKQIVQGICYYNAEAFFGYRGEPEKQ